MRGIHGAVGLFIGLAAGVLPRTSGAEECFPLCRAGYQCVQGRCLGSEPVAASAVVPGVTVLVAPRPETPEERALRLAEDERRNEVRRRFRLVGYLHVGYLMAVDAESAGVSLANGSVDEFGASWEDSGRVAAFGVGLGVRKNFETILGLQCRLMAELLPPLNALLLRGISPDELVEDATGMIYQVSMAPTLRIGPFAHVFPMYAGLGGVAGVRFVDIGSDTMSLVTSGIFFAGTLELGFIIGSEEKSDLGLQIVAGPDGLGIQLFFGLSFVSL